MLSGKIKDNPNEILSKEILEPQFAYELEHMLSGYIWIEQLLLLEYARLNILSSEEITEINNLLKGIAPSKLIADKDKNMSDISFAIEKYVKDNIKAKAITWHVDRSRNDLQATAQLMFCREFLHKIAEKLLNLHSAVDSLALRNISTPMPGYTHYQAAQVVTPGFYLCTLSGKITDTIKRLFVIYNSINKCPFGAGAMSGLELDWNRSFMAEMLGFDEPLYNALDSVASREWILLIAGELSNFGVTFSRFITDLIMWGSSEYQIIDLPDHLSGISSAMPQKKNFPILERIRGKTSHLSAFYVDFIMGQRNTPYTNLVETSKEAGTHILTAFNTMLSILKLSTLLFENLQFNQEKMLKLCAKEYLGGFSLANLLTLNSDIPYRTSQVIAGEYINSCLNKKLLPIQVDVESLRKICNVHGYKIDISEEALKQIFDIEQNIIRKKTIGSTHPDEVENMLTSKRNLINTLKIQWAEKKQALTNAYLKMQNLLTKIK